MKAQVILPPPGVFQTKEEYSKKRWRRTQHSVNEFWSRWRKEFLHSLQERPKWNKSCRNLEIGDIRSNWKLGRVTNIYPDETGLVRSVELIIGDASLDSKGKRLRVPTVVKRPIHKLILWLQRNNINDKLVYCNKSKGFTGGSVTACACL